MINILIKFLNILINTYYWLVRGTTRSIQSNENKELSTEPNQNIYQTFDGYQPIVMIANYNIARSLYQSIEYKSIIRTYPYLGYVFDRLLKHSIGAHSGKKWLEMKKPLAQFFTTGSVRHNYPMILEQVDKWIDGFESGSYQLQNLRLDRLTIGVISHIIYGKLSDEDLDELYHLSHQHNKMMEIMGCDMLMRIPIIYSLPLPNKLLVDEFWNRWCRFNDRMCESNNMAEQTLFQTMIRYPIYANDQLAFYQTLYEIMLFNLDIMIDGFANLIQSICANQGVGDRIYEECRDIDSHNYNEIDGLAYLQSVIWESARLNPGIVRTFAETLTQPVMLNDFFLPAGTMISLDTRMINRDPMVWKDPNQFDPSRFDSDPTMMFKYHRFGLSPRKCMGNIFADYILKIGIVQLIKKFTIHPSDEIVVDKERNSIPNLSNRLMTNQIIISSRNSC
jgi:cytochrome P450